MMAVSAKLYLIGHPRLELPCGREVGIPSRKAMALLALLVTSDRGERARTWLQRMLWGSRSPQQAQSSLRRELANLNKVLASLGLAILVSDHRVIRVLTDRLWIDLHDPLRAAGSGADFLEGIDLAGEEDFEDWLRDQRSRLADVRELKTHGAQPPAAAVRNANLRAALVALPAHDCSGTAEGKSLAGRVTRTLIGLLPRPRWLPIVPSNGIAPNPADLRDNLRISELLGTRYILQVEIALSPLGQAIQFTMLEMPAQIIRWSEARPVDPDIHPAALEHEIARAVNCICETFDLSEQRHVPAAGVNGEELVQAAWKIRFHINQFTRADFEIAEQLVQRALEQHPSHSELLMLRANLSLWQHWIERSDMMGSACLVPQIRAAMRADPADARGPLFSGILDTWSRRAATAVQHLTRACKLDPSSAQAFSHLGAAHYLRGNPEHALEPLEHAMFLAPLDPKRFHATGQIATVLWMLGRYEDALEKVREIQVTHPGYLLSHVIETAALQALGRQREAFEAWQQYFSRNPAKYHAMLDWMPFVEPRWNALLRDTVTGEGSEDAALGMVAAGRA